MSAKSQFAKLIQEHTSEVKEMVESATQLVLSIRADARLEVETSWGGYLLFKQSEGGNTVCYLSAHKKHATLGFAEGAELEDPSGLLQGTGKRQRHIKLKKDTDLTDPGVADIIKQAWARQPDSALLKEAVSKLGEICLALPDTTETESHGHPNFKVGKKSFAYYGIYSPSLAFKAGVELHAELEGDERFFPTPYMGHNGWLSIRLDAQTDWEEISELVSHSYTQVATKKQRAMLESRTRS